MVFVKGVLIGGADDLARLIDSVELKKMLAGQPGVTMTVTLESMLTCPHCSFATQETMPTDACVYFHECRNCKAMLRPKPSDCCVFCSYGPVKCPPIQERRGCCG